MFSRATALVHHWVRGHVRPGDTVVDATCGNGNDTLLLARLVGEQGKVIAVDVQSKALDVTRAALEKRNQERQVELHCMNHAMIGAVLSEEAKVRCALFNLGYLPGSDKSVITEPTSTIAAHETLLEHLSENGIIVTTVYTGHDGGQSEADALLTWCQRLDGKRFSVGRHEWVNQEGHPPFIFIIQRRPLRQGEVIDVKPN